MIVSMWMTREVVTAPPDMGVGRALALMREKRIRRLPVVAGEAAGDPIAGMVTLSDLWRAFPGHLNPNSPVAPDALDPALTLDRVMSRGVLTARAETPVEAAAAQMRDARVSALPVLNGTKLAGIITESDIFRAFVSIMGADVPGARVTFNVPRDQDVFALVAASAQEHDVRVVSFASMRQGERDVCVVRLAGDGVDAMVEDLWREHLAVMNVLRLP